MKGLKVILMALFLALPSFAFGQEACVQEKQIVESMLETPGSRIMEVIEGPLAQDWVNGTESLLQVDKLVVLEIPHNSVLLVLAFNEGCYLGHALVPRDVHLKLKLRVQNA